MSYCLRKSSITIGTNSNGEKTVVLGAEETQTKKNPAIIFIVAGMVILIVGAGTVSFILKKKYNCPAKFPQETSVRRLSEV